LAFRVFDGRHHLALRLSAFCAINPPCWPVCDSHLPPEPLERVNTTAACGQFTACSRTVRLDWCAAIQRRRPAFGRACKGR